jgi:hypothetical protein
MTDYELYFLDLVDGHIEPDGTAIAFFAAANDAAAWGIAEGHLAAYRKEWPDTYTYGADLHADPESNPRKVGGLT